MDTVFSEDEKRLIVGRAQTLSERLDKPEVLERQRTPDQYLSNLIEEWQSTFPTEQSFDNRLENIGATKRECKEAIAADRLVDSEPLPEWIEFLDDLITTVTENPPINYPDSLKSDCSGIHDEEHPFGEVSAAVAEYAHKGLSKEVTQKALSQNAIIQMMEWFRNRFEWRFVRILYVEFKTFVASRNHELAFADPDEYKNPSTSYYEKFIEYLLSKGMKDLCLEYPMFGRLVVTQICQWQDLIEEFSQRVSNDRDVIQERFGNDESLGLVSCLEPLADESHGDGRSVLRVSFESGTSVVYKPRSVEAGAMFYDVVEQINKHLSLPNLEYPNYIIRDGYGWMEWVRPNTCEKEGAGSRYYSRVGSLICIAYLLDFTDCHVENLRASGEYPVLVDAETVLQPYMDTGRRPIPTTNGALIDESVLRTLLLPYTIDATPEVHDESQEGILEAMAGIGLTSEEVKLKEIKFPVIRAVNTDVMSIETESRQLSREKNVPQTNDSDLSPDDYLAEIVSGFKETYNTVLSLRDTGELNNEFNLPNSFTGINSRFIYRPTVEYAQILMSLCSRDCMRDGARFGIELEQLAIPFLDGQVDEPQPWGLLEAEREALTRFDTPRFTTRTDGREIQFESERLSEYVDVSGLQRAEDRIQSASDHDLQRQVEYIRGCFGVSPDPSYSPDKASPVSCKTICDGKLINEAKSLFNQIQNARYESSEGTYYWNSVAPQNETERLTLQPARGSMYHGRPGIALLAAALYQLTDDPEYRQFAMKTLRPIREAINTAQKTETLEPNISNHGALTGIGSVVYSLQAIGRLLNSYQLIEEAVTVAGLVTEEFIEKDEMYDVVGGVAGTILGLLSVYEFQEGSGLLTAAADCGDYLLKNRIRAKNGTRVWKTLGNNSPQVGFAHGQSGIGYALIRLWEETGKKPYRDGALEALEFESANYSDDCGNWPDMRTPSHPTYPDQWCYGRSGIGIARIGMAKYTDDSTVTSGLERAVENATTVVGPHDHLCCGNAGRAEFLILADQGKEMDQARQIIGGMMSRKEETGAYRTPAGTKHIPKPSLFLGVSGIAYEMLRVINPEVLPCILLWE